MKPTPTKTKILNFAQEIIQKRGYNGFSYADISEEIGIRKASIHHHFPSKEALAIAVIQRYRESFNLDLVRIAAEGKDWLDKIRRYSKLYESVLHENKLCLCGMLASDIETLPNILKISIQEFFDDNIAWLSQVILLEHPTMPKKRLTDLSWQIISTLQGIVIMARMLNKPKLFTATSRELFTQLENI